MQGGGFGGGGAGTGGGGIVAGGGGGFDSDYVGKGDPRSGMVNPYSGPSGGQGQILTSTGGYVNPALRTGGSTTPNTGAGNQWDRWDFAKQGGGSSPALNQSVVSQAAPSLQTGGGFQAPAGLAGLSNQASGGQGMQSMSMAPQGLPAAPGMSMAKPNMKRKAKGGLGALANQASGMGMMQKPNLTYG
jgi:hypothetical protein